METRLRPAWLTRAAGAHGSGPATLGPLLPQQRKKGQWEKNPQENTVAQENAWLPPATSRAHTLPGGAGLCLWAPFPQQRSESISPFLNVVLLEPKSAPSYRTTRQESHFNSV